MNNCLNGEPITYRYFDVTTGGASAAFFINPGASASQPLTCNTGDKICFGGRQPNHGLFWGVDVDGTKGCPNCCFDCANQSVSMPPLTCF